MESIRELMDRWVILKEMYIENPKEEIFYELKLIDKKIKSMSDEVERINISK